MFDTRPALRSSPYARVFIVQNCDDLIAAAIQRRVEAGPAIQQFGTEISDIGSASGTVCSHHQMKLINVFGRH
jgi:hypothetical protein